jgi:O-antigen/teichoic acid export membrane protein
MTPRGIARNSALALAGDLAAKAGAAAVMMVAARALATDEFAVLATALALATVLTALLDAGSQTLLTRDGTAGPGARRELLRALVRARLPLVTVALVAGAVVGAATDRPLAAVLTMLLATAGAAQLSLTGTLRSAQDLRPEAGAKLAAGLGGVALAAVAVAVSPSSTAVLASLAVSNLLALLVLRPALRAAVPVTAAPDRRVRAAQALRRAAPLGVMALATLAYYRSGTIALGLFSSPTQTGRFATASTVAFGLLCLGNAITTGLLPRLAAAHGDADRASVTRRALAFAGGSSMLLGGGVALLARPLLTLMFGPRYAAAAEPLALLALATVPISAAGVLGTALIAAGRLRPVALQIAVSLAVNLVALSALVPVAGALGAAGATLACETVALAILGWAATRSLPGLIPVRPSLGPIAAGASARGGR